MHAAMLTVVHTNEGFGILCDRRNCQPTLIDKKVNGRLGLSPLHYPASSVIYYYALSYGGRAFIHA